MASRGKRIHSRATRRSRGSSATGQATASGRGVSELAEALDIMLPELSARLAAIEHALVDRQLCTRDDLLRAREFVDLRRGTS